MDAITPVNAAPLAQAPIHTPDVRPTADTAAIIRNPQPDLPMAIPASMGQTAEVNQSRLSASASLGQVEAIERVLKPYNVTMLPHDPGQNGNNDTMDPNEDATLTSDTDAFEEIDFPVMPSDEETSNDSTQETRA